MTNRMRVARAAAIAALLAITVAGCVGIPSGGGVNPGPLVHTGGDSPYVTDPGGPPRNASTTALVNDFLQAATSADGNYAIAKEFLTAKAAQTWDPTKSVLVREKPATPQDVGSDTVDYSVSTRASVNALGEYVEQSTDSTQTLSFTFTKVAGQWRISDLPDGIVLSRTSFENFFNPYPIYFFDPDFRYLVPDVRWFPTGPTVQDRIVAAVLAGPSDWLQQGIVESAFPAGVQRGSPVSVHNSTATVDFSANAASTKQVVRGQMLRQLQQSLVTTHVTSVLMTAKGAPLAVADGQESLAQPAVATNGAPLLQKGKQFGFYPGLLPIGTISSQVAALSGTAASVDHSQSAAAVLAKAGVYLVTSGATKLVDARPGLIPPSIDSFGYAWTVPSNDASAIHAVGADGAVHPIASQLPPGAKIVALAVSRDGTRVLAYISTSAGSRLVVAGIVRRAGVPVSLGTLLDLPVASGDPVDATWLDPSTVAALTSDAGVDTVVNYVIGGSPGDPSTTEGALRLVGATDADSLRLLTDDGEVQQLRASGWQNIGVVASVLATQQ